MWKGAVFSFSVPHVVLLAACCLLWSIIHVSSTHTLEEESHPCHNWCTADFSKLSSILGIVGTVHQSAVICWNSLNMAQFFDPDSTTCFFFTTIFKFFDVLIYSKCKLSMSLSAVTGPLFDSDGWKIMCHLKEHMQFYKMEFNIIYKINFDIVWLFIN